MKEHSNLFAHGLIQQVAYDGLIGEFDSDASTPWPCRGGWLKCTGQWPGGNVIRTMKMGRRYRCQNPDCRAEIEVKKDSIEGELNPRCCCGAEMKKPYSAPVLKQVGKNAGDLAKLFKDSAAQR